MFSNDALAILDSDRLRELLPQRYPFLMIDRVMILTEQQAIGIKNITINEPCFAGHFPGNPVLPGMLMLEAMIQTSAALIRHLNQRMPKMLLLLAIDKAKFRRPVSPGDRLQIDVKLACRRAGIARLLATASVNADPVGQASFMLGTNQAIRQRLRPANFAPALTHASLAAKPSPIMTVRDIMQVIPHRYPFLLVDAILHQDDKRIIAIKNVTGNEPFFNGHFPECSLMPGTLLVEAMAQAGAVFMLNLPQHQGKIGYFMSMEKARFRRPVCPGDQLLIELELQSHRSQVGRAWGQIFVGSDLVAEAGFAFIIAGPLQDNKV